MSQEPRTPSYELRNAFETLKNEGLIERLSAKTSNAFLQDRAASVGLEDEAFARYLADAYRDEVVGILEMACLWRYLNTDTLRPVILESAIAPIAFDWRERGKHTAATPAPPPPAEPYLNVLRMILEGEPPRLGAIAQAGLALQKRDSFLIYHALDLLSTEQLDAAYRILNPIHSGYSRHKDRDSATSNIGFILYEKHNYTEGIKFYRRVSLGNRPAPGPTLDWLFGSIMATDQEECTKAIDRLRELAVTQTTIAEFARRRQALALGGSLPLDRSIKRFLCSLPDSSLAQPVIEALK